MRRLGLLHRAMVERVLADRARRCPVCGVLILGQWDAHQRMHEGNPATAAGRDGAEGDGGPKPAA